MSLDELNQRIKDEVVLREGDLFEWQWRQLGLVADADALGVSADEFLTLVNEVSRAINPYFGRISDLKVKVADLARLQRKKLTAAQIDQIVADAARLQLGPEFIKARWIPAIVATIPEPSPETIAPAVAEPVQPALVEPAAEQKTTQSSTAATPFAPPVPATIAAPILRPAEIDRSAVMQKVHQFLDEYKVDKHIPAGVLKTLFLATNFDETVLADAVLAYLSANFYAAETPVRGELLKDKLLSANWRHLSWWASTPASPAAPVVAVRAADTAPRGSSDSSVIGMAVVAVGLLIGAVWWVTGRTTETPKATVTRIKPADTITTATPVKKKLRRKSRTGQH